MKTILGVILVVVLFSAGCARPSNPLAQNISSNESVTHSSNISQSVSSPPIASANVVWPDITSLPFASENVLYVNEFQFHASLFVRFSGNTTLSDGTIIFSQFYEDDGPCLWWPVNQPIKIENGFWTIITPLGVNGSPDTMIPGRDYYIVVYSDSLKAGHHFLVGSGPPANVTR